jgi:fibrillarin-like pre-rRNA processing protein
MEIREIFNGVYRINGKLATENLARGIKVYDEDLISAEDREYRTWNPYRSKLAASILKSMKNMEIREGSNVLYLGAATGTTCSHISDIIKSEGSLYCVEFSERNMRQLLDVCEKRENMFPIFKDARKVEEYAENVGTVDILYQDLSAKDQADLLLLNGGLLKRGGYAYVAIKSQSISVSKPPKQVYREFFNKVSTKFQLLESIDIMPFDRMHMFAVFKKK